MVVSSEVTGLGTSSVRTREVVRKPDGTVAAEGECVLVPRDTATRRSRPLTPAERRRVDAALAAATTAPAPPGRP